MVGLPDEKYGEVVAAFVVPVVSAAAAAGGGGGGDKHEIITEMQVRDWVRERLSHHLVPKYVFWKADGFPKTASGKIQKFKLREEGVELMNDERRLGASIECR